MQTLQFAGADGAIMTSWVIYSTRINLYNKKLSLIVYVLLLVSCHALRIILTHILEGRYGKMLTEVHQILTFLRRTKLFLIQWRKMMRKPTLTRSHIYGIPFSHMLHRVLLPGEVAAAMLRKC